MSRSGKPPLENAVEIIEKFGGIRPMASKTGVAVTTIQGWKKRGVIPGARKESIIESAIEHNIDISGLLEGAPSFGAADAVVVSEVVEVADKDSTPIEQPKVLDDVRIDDGSDGTESIDSGAGNIGVDADTSGMADTEADTETSTSENAGVDDDLEIPAALKRTVEAESRKKSINDLRAKRMTNGDYAEFTLESKKSPVSRSIIIASVIILLILAALAGFVIPKHNSSVDRRNAHIQELERQLSSIKKEQSGFKGLVPENWSVELEQLKHQAEQVKRGVSSKVGDVKALSHDLASAQGISHRVKQLQTYVSEISGNKGVYALKSRFDKMRRDYMGEKVLNNSVESLLPIIRMAKGKGAEHVNSLIDDARTKDKALQASLGNVPKNELKAAAMLLAMTQVRSALNRQDKDFESDLQLLMGMVGEDNIELRAAIKKLAPYSREGVLTPSGLKNEFQSVAGEAVAASLRGEDVSVSEKLSAKFNELLKVEKNGELLTGTQTQATINKAEKMVEKEQFDAAIRMLKSNLHAKELEPLQPWIRKAERLVASKKLSDMLEEAIELNFGSGLLGGKVLEHSN